MIQITTGVDFCYAHVLEEHKGKCSNLHGHNGRIEVTLGKKGRCFGETDTLEDNMVIDFSSLKKMLQVIAEKLDHKLLNEVEEMADFLPPTAENIVFFVLCELKKTYNLDIIRCVRVYETPNSYAEWIPELNFRKTVILVPTEE